MPADETAARRREIEARLSALEVEQQERLARRRAAQASLPYVDLFAFPLEPATLALLDRPTAEATGAVLFYKRGRDVRLGIVNPAVAGFAEVLEGATRRLGVKPKVYVISHHSLQFALSRYRVEGLREGLRDELIVDAALLKGAEAELAVIDRARGGPTALAPTRLLATILAGALARRASDVHIEPTPQTAYVRYRIDGVLQPAVELDLTMWRHILSRVKVLSQLKLNIHDVPQEGNFVVRLDGRRADVRVSVLPGGYGEYIVLRLLSRQDVTVTLERLGMKERDLLLVREELKASTGLVLAAGPTGSGKTTTIVACLALVNRPELKVISLEDPIEYRVAGVEQTEVDTEAGYTFAVGLRSILRQDPDIIFVGEIRDTETAETSVHAALTGHLVFTTLHTNDAPGAVLRLMNIGIQPYVLAPAINLVIAQRLVRLVCPQCAEVYRPPAKLREHIREVMSGVRRDVFDPRVLDKADLTFRRARGCSVCSQTGYRGRTGVFEVFAVHGEIEELILRKADTMQIRGAALRAGMTTIAQDGYLKVLAGLTTVEEVQRISEE